MSIFSEKSLQIENLFKNNDKVFFEELHELLNIYQEKYKDILYSYKNNNCIYNYIKSFCMKPFQALIQNEELSIKNRKNDSFCDDTKVFFKCIQCTLLDENNLKKIKTNYEISRYKEGINNVSFILNNIDKKCIPKKKLYAVESIILSENFDFVNTFYMPLCSLIGEICLVILFVIFASVALGQDIQNIIVFLFPIIIFFFLIFFTGKKRLERYIELSISLRKRIGRKINLLLSSLPDLKLINAIKSKVLFRYELSLLANTYFKISFLKEMLSYIYENFFISIVALFIFLISLNFTEIKSTSNLVIFAIVLFIRIGPSLSRIMVGVGNVFQGIIKLERISEYLNKPKEYNPYKVNTNLNSLILKISGKPYKFLKQIKINNLFIFKIGINKLNGNNGSGKSTILNIIMGINYGFKVEINLPSKKIVYLNQTPFNLYSKVYEELNLKENKSTKKEVINLIKIILRKNKISHSAMIDNLSGGQRQIISLCRIITEDPKIVILDEPFNSLDKKNIKLFSKIFRDISKDKIIILVDHFNMLKEDRVIDINKQIKI